MPAVWPTMTLRSSRRREDGEKHVPGSSVALRMCVGYVAVSRLDEFRSPPAPHYTAVRKRKGLSPFPLHRITFARSLLGKAQRAGERELPSGPWMRGEASGFPFSTFLFLFFPHSSALFPGSLLLNVRSLLPRCLARICFANAATNAVAAAVYRKYFSAARSSVLPFFVSHPAWPRRLGAQARKSQCASISQLVSSIYRFSSF